MNKVYNIGLDIGTTSVGWAVVEKETNKVMGKGNKALWGVRLFDEAITASERRSFRSARRRYERRKKRICLLQEEFQNEIEKVDSDFYSKLNESFYWESDKENKKHPLSIAEKEMIKEYHKEYPTIYHLRKALIHNPVKIDIRLVYLAIHHIIKYRGNFLNGANEFNVKDLNIEEKLKSVFSSISSLCEEMGLEEDQVEDIKYSEIEKAILNPSKSDRKRLLEEQLKPFFNASKESKSVLSALINLILGNQFSISKLFNIELEEDIKINLSGSDFDEKYDNLGKVLETRIETLSLMKELYDTIFLKTLFGNRDNNSLSDLMVDYYDEHERDLEFLKQILNYDRKEYRKVFRTNKKYTCLYDEYIHNIKTYDDFIRELKKSLEKVINIVDTDISNKYITEIQPRMERGYFLPRITSTSNGKYPYQLNKSELKVIIENQGKYYPFLLDKADNEYKLIKLLSFKIPYYVGPLVDSSKSEFAWMSRNAGMENIKITPYNFDQVVNKEKSAEKFITKMLGHCSYLLKEVAMPTNSLLYSEFKVLNELKQIRVNNERLSHKFQHRVMDEFFRKENGSLTDKKFQKFLIKSREFDMYNGELTITGYSADKKFANTLGSYIDFYGEDGFFKDTNLKISDAEEIIRWITIFEDKDILATKIEKEYPALKSVIPRIIKKKYTGWSSLSEKLLTTPYYVEPETSLKKSIIDLMWETNDNFMQIITDEKYHFQDMIAEENGKEDNKKLNYQLVDALSTSPATKRGIWQALKAVEEIIDYVGYEPDSISIEMARGDEKKKRKDDRKKYLMKLYENAKESMNDYNRLYKELSNQESVDRKAEKLFLYFIQEGKSLYSATPLDISRLEEYEVDHILPQTLIKNDSIENKALVLKEENQEKAASLVLPKRFQANKNWWEHLKKIGLISATKFHNLIRKEFKEEDIEGFINRQLVETRQITKHVANIIKKFHPASKVLYLPASLSHNYREKFELYKFRDLNDYHHAHDAYLAAALGEYKEHCNLKINYEDLQKLNKELYESKKYKELKYGFIINSIDSAFIHFNSKTGEVFDVDKFKDIVKSTLYRNDILISKKTEIRTGGFYNQTKSKKGQKGVPLKNNLRTELYGSYTSLNPAYAIVVKYTKKGQKSQRMIGMPVYYKTLEKKQPLMKDEYIRKTLKLSLEDTFEIVTSPIPFYSEFNWNGQVCALVGASDKVEVCNAKQFQLTSNEMRHYKLMLSRLLNGRKKLIDDAVYSRYLSDFIDLIINKVEKEYVLYQNLVSDMKIMFSIKDEEVKLEIEAKEKVIIQLLKLLKCDSDTANLKFLDNSYSMAFGKKNGRIIDHATIINKSVTGLRSRRNEF